MYGATPATEAAPRQRSGASAPHARVCGPPPEKLIDTRNSAAPISSSTAMTSGAKSATGADRAVASTPRSRAGPPAQPCAGRGLWLRWPAGCSGPARPACPRAPRGEARPRGPPSGTRCPGRPRAWAAAAQSPCWQPSGAPDFVRGAVVLAGIGVDAVGADQDRGAALFAHHPVVGVEVLVGAARRGEYLAQQQAQPLRVDGRVRVVRADEVDAALGRRPLPSGPDDDVRVRALAPWASFFTPPRMTMPTTVSPVTGCASTPAFTTDEAIVPSFRVAETTTSP